MKSYNNKARRVISMTVFAGLTASATGTCYFDSFLGAACDIAGWDPDMIPLFSCDVEGTNRNVYETYSGPNAEGGKQNSVNYAPACHVRWKQFDLLQGCVVPHSFGPYVFQGSFAQGAPCPTSPTGTE